MHSAREPSARALGQQARAFIYAAVACTVMPCGAGAYELRQTSRGAFVRWESEPVPFVVDPSLEAAAPGAVDAALRAIASWSHAGHGPELVARVGTERATRPSDDGQNTILYMPDGYAPAGGALAVTISTVEPDTGELVDTDIVINGRHAFAVLARSARASANTPAVATEGSAESTATFSTPFDLEHVIAHELGHALGLADVRDDTQAVMYAYTRAGDASNRKPTGDDVAGLDSLYAAMSDERDGGGCSASSATHREAPGVFAALSIGAAVALARWRARGIRAGWRRRAC